MELSISYSDEKGKKSEKILMRTKRSGAAVGPKGILYLASIDFEARLCNHGSEIKIDTFQQPLVPQIYVLVDGKCSGDYF